MTYCLKVLAHDPDVAHAILLDWSEEMQTLDTFRKCGFNLRSYLAHHLAMIGMDEVAYK